ncbi:hypothetical protein AAGS40_15680 [Paraburkholderia sp. PREW-6R]|uniref:hypothetical protein n=1 Tax=Paraburkholderia sp. PREW-6R TaxID=3141544 RepID=UPI0031F53B9B
MRRDKRLASVALVVLATFALATTVSLLGGCGADDAAPNSAASPPAAVNDDTAQRAQPAWQSATSGGLPGASSPLSADPSAASDVITQNMQASLAADSRQVPPVMRYAPGDSAGNN